METATEQKSDPVRRRLARLAAVQGLYQLALLPEPAQDLIKRFRATPSVLLQEQEISAAVDISMFSEIVAGVSDNLDSLDGLIAGAMSEHLSPDRLEALLRAILRAGAYELLHRGAVPANIIVNDYIDVAHGFFNAKEPGLVNAVLDRLAKALRT